MKATTIAIALACMLLLGACTRYHVKRADGAEVSVWSNREFKNLSVEYTSPQGATFKASAGEVNNGPSPWEQLGIDVLRDRAGLPAKTQPAPIGFAAPEPEPEQ